MSYTFRPLAREDFELLSTWIGQPHIQKWWHDSPKLEDVVADYAPCIDGTEATRVYIVSLDDKPMGMIQCYLTDDYRDEVPDWDAAGFVGIDYLIGVPQLVGQGHGSAMIKAFIDEVVRPEYPSAKGVVSDPEVANLASVGALRRAGLVPHKIIPKGEYGTPEQLMIMNFQ